MDGVRVPSSECYEGYPATAKSRRFPVLRGGRAVDLTVAMEGLIP